VRAALERERGENDGHCLAVRLDLDGACAAHAELRAAAEHWVQEFRALASGLDEQSLWLEKVVLRSRPELLLDEAMQRDDALGGLLRTLRDLRLDETQLAGLAQGLTPLRHKLLRVLADDREGGDPTCASALGAALDEVKELLLSRLLRAQRAP
jgi:hypothetical protein